MRDLSVLCGDAFKEEYKKRGLATKNLSRTTEDAGTVVEPIILVCLGRLLRHDAGRGDA